jgi:hypothetical protein
VTRYSKSSVVLAHTCGCGIETEELGWESGGETEASSVSSQQAADILLPDPASLPPSAPHLDEISRELREELVDALDLPREQIGVRASWAAVEERLRKGPKGVAARTMRELRAAQILIGLERDCPRWSRILALPGAVRRWPPGVIEQVAAEFAGWDAPETKARDLGELGEGPVRLGAFALCDLLRVEAMGWLAGSARPGDRVGPPGMGVRDGGFFFPSRGGDFDGWGDPVQPVSVVEDGLLLSVPRGVGGVGAAGFAIRDSWRRPPRIGWRSLELALAPAELAPGPVVLTRLQFLGGMTFGFGWIARGSRPAASFGPVRVPPPGAWLAGLRGGVGPAVHDATGFPVTAPSALAEP